MDPGELSVMMYGICETPGWFAECWGLAEPWTRRGSASFGEGSGGVLLNVVNCDGTEDNLADCAHSGVDRSSCSHKSDAGAVCYSGGRFFVLVFIFCISLHQ